MDVIVVGAGHAGCEAALAASRLGARVAVITLRLGGIAQMSCNPAIGGVGKGHLVREIDALGGAMGQVADATGIQFRRLNLSRGPAVRSTRAQADAARYQATMAERLAADPNIALIEGEVVALERQGGMLTGVRCASGLVLRAQAVVITTGTFLRAACHVGDEQFAGGRLGDAAAGPLSQALMDVGLSLRRFKTGTTPRLDAASIDFSVLEVQAGDAVRPRFSFDAVANDLPQRPCHIGYTTAATHQIVRDNLDRSPLYGGIIQGLGPRYCPSLEDKVVRFADKPRHQVFFEPEGLDTDRIYPAGLSTSLPRDAQQAFLQTIPGLGAVRILQHGYAVEYDYAPPTQLTPALMAKAQPGLFLAGQINGSSGYEEAAAQGLMAGLNAVRWLGGEAPAVLGRDQAYIGVLIDDLVTQGVDEPYRIFTSRAEHRLTLRESNAEGRLLGPATTWRLLPEARRRAAEDRLARQAALLEALERPVGGPLARALGINDAAAGMTRAELLRRPGMVLADVLRHVAAPGDDAAAPEAPPTAAVDVDDDVSIAVEEVARYAGYIAREQRVIAGLRKIEAIRLAPGRDYRDMQGLSGELREKLTRVAPTTLGQASRIPGMTPTALALLQGSGRRGDSDHGA